MLPPEAVRRFHEGRSDDLWTWLGPIRTDSGVRFSVWAPSAAGVSVVGEFNAWDPARDPLVRDGDLWVGEVEGIDDGALYKLSIDTGAARVLHADPMARWSQGPPETASRLFTSRFVWGDQAWMADRPVPRSIYELHPGSWMRHGDGTWYGWRDLAERLPDHVLGLGFTHVELMGVSEHPFGGSWGYQVSGYYAPTARHGSPDDLRYFVDTCHRRGIGVLMDWVPAHFVRDEHGLGRFDGTALYEHPDPRRGEHPDWGTYVFDFGRPQVRSFLLSNALYWLHEFHLDGIRVDAVASMLYLDYSRAEGQWLPNEHGGNLDLGAAKLLRDVNDAVRHQLPGVVTIAEESTTFAGVTKPTDEDGLGFTYKWNLGWMHDTLDYFQTDPVHRRHHHHKLTFAMTYEHSERFINPLSHDEVVHGKGSLLRKMARGFDDLRVLLTYQYTRPGPVTLFMGTELAPDTEWDDDRELPWGLKQNAQHGGIGALIADLGRLQAERPCLWRGDTDPGAFRWINADDAEHSVYSYLRIDGDDRLVVVLATTPVHYHGHRIGVPELGVYDVLVDTRARRYGGPGQATTAVVAEDVAADGQPASVRVDLIGIGALVLAPRGHRPALDALADALGIGRDYHDVEGRRHVPPTATVEAITAALGFPAGTEAEARGSLRRVPKPKRSPASKARCPSVREVLGDDRCFGLCVNLYTVRSDANQGVGDLSDLARIARWGAEHGAEFVGLNPLHAARNAWPEVSPYGPITRLFRNPLYIDVTAVSGFTDDLLDPDELAAVRAADNVDYDRVWALKESGLRRLYRPTTDRSDALLSQFAAFQVMCDVHGRPWQDWPEGLRSGPRGKAYEAFCAEHAEEIDFHRWLQRVLDGQLAAAAKAATDAGMKIGVYEDLALGSAQDGFDTWCFGDLFVSGPTLGCPPDPLGPDGQNWALPPLHPHRLTETGFAFWSELLERAFAHAGALRIDHVLGLVRQFWIPAWRPASEGAYVAFPTHQLLGILARHARGAGALVVGEDLGTLPPGMAETLADFGVLSTRVAMFERDHTGFRAASQLSDRALLTATTHDLPPLRGWIDGTDLRIRHKLGRLDDLEAALAGRALDVAALTRRLTAEGIDSIDLVVGVHEWLASSPSPLVGVWLDDLAGETQPVNVPGLDQQTWPSWTRRLGRTLDGIARDRTARAILAASKR